MPFNSAMTARVIGYVPKETKQRMDKLRKLDPWLTMSAQVEKALRAWLASAEVHHTTKRTFAKGPNRKGVRL